MLPLVGIEPLAQDSYKNNHGSEGIRVANARTKVIIFCKSRPSNCI